MTNRRKFTYLGIVAVFLSMCIVILLCIDLHYHQKMLGHAGLNHRGYRGEVVGKKEKDEIRIAVLGSSIVFGYGVHYDKALPAQLEKELVKHYGNDRKITVVNLAYNIEGAYAFYYNLKDFLYLDYDYVIFYSGDLDLSPGNVVTARYSNPIFRTFGYMPVLPLIAKEKIMLLRRETGRLNPADGENKIIFTLAKKNRNALAALEKMLLEHEESKGKIDKIKKMKNTSFDTERLKTNKWSWYTHFMKKAIDFALANNKKVIVVTSPFLNERHRAQQKALKEMLDKTYGKNIFYINKGNALSIKNEGLFYDGWHMSEKGCEIMAELLAEEIVPYLARDNKL